MASTTQSEASYADARLVADGSNSPTSLASTRLEVDHWGGLSLEDSLVRFLDRASPLRSSTEQTLCQAALRTVDSACRAWILQQCGDISVWENHGPYVLPFGSEALGLQEAGADVDVLLLSSAALLHLQTLRGLFEFLNSGLVPDIKDASMVEGMCVVPHESTRRNLKLCAGRVPHISATVFGISVDMVSAQLPVAQLPNPIDVQAVVHTWASRILDDQIRILSPWDNAYVETVSRECLNLMHILNLDLIKSNAMNLLLVLAVVKRLLAVPMAALRLAFTRPAREQFVLRLLHRR